VADDERHAPNGGVVVSAIVFALLAFTVFLAAQLVLWRLWKPAWQYAVLPGLALLVLVAAMGISRAFAPSTSPFLPSSIFDYGNFVVLYAALVLAYFVTYPAVQADSPSMTIVLLIDRAGPGGLAREELAKALDNQSLVLPRLEDLVAGNLVRLEQGRYVINSSGALLAGVHVRYRRLLKMEKGG